MQNHPEHRHSSHSRVSLRGVKYIAGAVATAMVADGIKTAGTGYLLLAVVAGVGGMIETAWREPIRAQRDEARGRSLR
jgi:hypothetical protein